jgi:hypothetical protein
MQARQLRGVEARRPAAARRAGRREALHVLAPGGERVVEMFGKEGVVGDGREPRGCRGPGVCARACNGLRVSPAAFPRPTTHAMAAPAPAPLPKPSTLDPEPQTLNP